MPIQFFFETFDSNKNNNNKIMSGQVNKYLLCFVRYLEHDHYHSLTNQIK